MPICGSETLGGAVPFRKLLAADALDVVMLDLAWCGGLTEGRKIAALAEAYAKPLAPHDCTGPVTLMAGLHLALHAPTAIFQEVVRATLADLVPRPRHRSAGSRERHGAGADRAGPGHRAAIGGAPPGRRVDPRVRPTITPQLI